jgi:hypothetical protein
MIGFFAKVKMRKFALILVAALIVLQGYVALETMPEFQESGPLRFKDKTETSAAENDDLRSVYHLQHEIHWNAMNGKVLATALL